MTINDAIESLKKKFPTKKIVGDPVMYKGKYCFSMTHKDAPEEDVIYDPTITTVDIDTGEISNFHAFSDVDFWSEAKPIH